MQQGYYLNYYEPMWRKPAPMYHSIHNTPQGSHATPGPHIAPGSTMAPVLPTVPGSPTNIGTDYTQGYLRSQIGKRMRVTFLLGTNLIQDRIGVLEEVGISYITLRDDETSNLVMCDIYSIKFVNIFK